MGGRAKNGAHGVGNGHHAKANGHNGATPIAHAPTTPSSKFSIPLSVTFLLGSFVLSTAVAFLVGWTARVVLLGHLGVLPPPSPTANDDASLAVDFPANSGGMSRKLVSGGDDGGEDGTGRKKPKQLPAPKVIEGKDVPFTTYASKNFQTAGVATSNTLHIDRSAVLLMSKSRKEFDGGPDFSSNATDDDAGESDETGEGDGWVPCNEKACSRGKEKAETVMNDEGGHNDDSDGLHLPAGQHLLVDIKDVDSRFLNSEERLARAMIELTNLSGLTLLSYHCHSLVPIGVSCAGVLLESHVAFHTWPMEGVITLDLFTCGGGLLIPTLPAIEELFAVPQTPGEGETADDFPSPTMLWSHKLRGFREGFAPGYVRSKNPLDGSLGRYVLGKLDFDLKRPLLSTKTGVHNVNIYEVMETKNRDIASYVKSLAGDEESYEARHPEHFGPDKVLFLDGIIQSTLYGDAPYHESIVHPAMITQSNPKRVAIIGGGEGATLREVLKYKSVDEVVILEIDRELVEICSEYMPEWSDCSDVEGSDVLSCFDDSRARVVYGDAFRWFVDHFGRGEGGEDRFDVVIMDALDPNTSVEIAGGLYNDTSFIGSLFNGLSDDGVFVVQLGKAKMSTDPSDEYGRWKDTALMIEGLKQSGFESIHTYDEGHSNFYMPWSYLVAFKDYKTRAGWHRTAPEIEIQLQQRLHGTKSGKPALRYFDANTMIGYQMPSKASETAYCRKEEMPYECDEYLGFDPDTLNIPAEHLKVGKSGISMHAGRGLFTTKKIPKEASIALRDTVQAFQLRPLTWSVVEKLEQWGDDNSKVIPFVDEEISGLYTFVEGYGHGAMLLGEAHMAVDSTLILFMNHGCNGTYNYGYVYEEDHPIITELNVNLDNQTEVMEHLTNMAEGPYSPVFDRHWQHVLNSGDYALRDIKKGEEVLTSYLAYAGNPDEFEEDIMNLRSVCAGGVGPVKEYETGSSSQ